MSERLVSTHCPQCRGCSTVSRFRLRRDSVDITTGKVVRSDCVAWTDEYECGCGYEWKAGTLKATAPPTPTPDGPE